MHKPEMTEAEILQMNQIKWWHRIPLPGPNNSVIFTPGEVRHGADGADYASNRFGLPLSLKGKTVFDIGSWDGYFSFESERRGASWVVAADIYKNNNLEKMEKSNWGGNHGFRFAQRILHSKVEFIDSGIYDLPVNVKTFPKSVLKEKAGFPSDEEVFNLDIPKFDVVLFYGVLYHLSDPLTALHKLASLTKWVALVETAHVPGPAPTMLFQRGKDNDPTNFWYPTIPCLDLMLKDAGFREVSVLYKDDTRCTLAAYK